MKSDFLDFIGNARRRRNEKFRNQLYIFVVCLILSVFIWSLVRLSKDYYYTVDFRLSYTHIPAHLELQGCSDTVLRIRFRIQGFEYFSEQLFRERDHKYEVSLQDVRYQAHGDHPRGFLLTGRVGREILSQTNFPADLYSISPDTLYFDFDQLPIELTPVATSVEGGRSVMGTDSVGMLHDSLPRHGERPEPPSIKNP